MRIRLFASFTAKARKAAPHEYGAAGRIPHLRVRPKGAALWNPAAFVKAGETFDCASRAFIQPLIRVFTVP